MANLGVSAALTSLIPNPSISASQVFLTDPSNLSLSREHVSQILFLTFSLLPPMTFLIIFMLHTCFKSLPPGEPDPCWRELLPNAGSSSAIPLTLSVPSSTLSLCSSLGGHAGSLLLGGSSQNCFQPLAHWAELTASCSMTLLWPADPLGHLSHVTVPFQVAPDSI